MPFIKTNYKVALGVMIVFPGRDPGGSISLVDTSLVIVKVQSRIEY